MECSITDGEQMPEPTLLDEQIDEENQVAQIALKLIEGDIYSGYPATKPYTFQDVAEDELTCNAEFTNALRRFALSPWDRERSKALQAAIQAGTAKAAKSIYDNEL